MALNRRELLMKTLFGTGMVGLRALATGLPISFLMNPRRALANGGLQPRPLLNQSGYAPQFLIFSTSGNGDPSSCNTPGTYVADPNVLHPPGTPGVPTTDMTPTQVTVGGVSYTTALPWSTINLNNTCFFHHGTYTVVHPDEHNVLKLMNELYVELAQQQEQEMLVSALSAALSAPNMLNTLQPEPISIGGGGAAETLSFQGRPQANLTPLGVKALLTAPTVGDWKLAPASLQKLRDNDLDSLNNLVKSEGNAAQKAFIDSYANSQKEARQISETLLTNLNNIASNKPNSQIDAALILIQMKVTPVITIHIPFGGDNHSDTNWTNEATQHVAGCQTLLYMQQQLAAYGLSNQVSFAMLNVFGRTFTTANSALVSGGRSHHGNHHCAVLMGSQFKGSVVGGMELATHPVAGQVGGSNDYRATSIDPTSGASVPNNGGAIPFNATLSSMAKTLATGVGVDPSAFVTQDSASNPIGTKVSAALVNG